MCCSVGSVLQCVAVLAVCCSVLQCAVYLMIRCVCDALSTSSRARVISLSSVVQCVALCYIRLISCCSVSQCVALCHIML